MACFSLFLWNGMENNQHPKNKKNNPKIKCLGTGRTGEKASQEKEEAYRCTYSINIFSEEPKYLDINFWTRLYLCLNFVGFLRRILFWKNK